MRSIGCRKLHRGIFVSAFTWNMTQRWSIVFMESDAGGLIRESAFKEMEMNPKSWKSQLHGSFSFPVADASQSVVQGRVAQ